LGVRTFDVIGAFIGFFLFRTNFTSRGSGCSQLEELPEMCVPKSSSDDEDWFGFFGKLFCYIYGD
jgi:hypothetical protein